MATWAEKQVYGKILTKNEWEKKFDSEISQRTITFIQSLTLILSIVLGFFLIKESWLLIAIPIILIIIPFTRGLANILACYLVLIPIFYIIDKLGK